MFCHIAWHFLMIWHSISHLQKKMHIWMKIASPTSQIKILIICSFSALLSPLWDKQCQSTHYCYLYYDGCGDGVHGGGDCSGGGGGGGGGGGDGGFGRVIVVA